jgi:hypothetical protein
MPGMVRASFGSYSSTDDIDQLADMLGRIVRKDYKGNYEMDISSGEFLPAGYKEPLAHYLPLATGIELG